MDKVKIEYLHNNSVARIILDDGKGNILDGIMMNELHQVFSTLRNMNDIKLITFEGAGKHFSYGASVAEHTKDKALAMLKSFHRMFYDIIDLSIPSLAKISGQCLGGGMELALICNFLFADKSAKMGQPEIILGVFPPPASIILPLKIGSARAEELIITGKTISAIEANDIGLLNEVFEDRESMESALNEWIEKNILPKSASSLRFAVNAARFGFNEIIRNDLPRIEKYFLNDLMNTNDANEGINSFLEKRKAEWKNC
jgi:cyclohexa-1,5-dienecarbonyl-CoA hydratase